MSDDEFVKFCLENGFISVRKLEDGEWVGLFPLLFTMSVCTGIEQITPFKYRWCFKDISEAENFYNTLMEYDEIPKERKSLKGHRYQTSPLLNMHGE